MTNTPFQAPMPSGMAYPVNDEHDQAGNAPVYHEHTQGETIEDSKPRKGKKLKVYEPVEKELFGYLLELAPAKTGENKSWQRVGKRALPFEQRKLFSMVTSHRGKTRTGPAYDLAILTSAQQGVINRLIDEHKLKEKNPNADWVLVDVQKFGQRRWKSLDVKTIQVIIKRHDKSLNKPRDTIVNPNLGGYQEFEIIDLAEPRLEKKKSRLKKSSIDDFEFDDPPALNVSTPQDGPPANPANHQQGGYVQDPSAQQRWHDPDYTPQHQQQPQHLDPMNHVASGGPPLPPPGSIPVGTYSARQPTGNNPFIPYPIFMPPLRQYDSNVPNNPANANQYAHRPAARTSPIPAPPERRSSSRQRSSSAARLRAALERERADNAELQAQLERLNLNQHPRSDHSTGTRYSEASSVFSQFPVGEAFTPPSTPPRSDYYESRRTPLRRNSVELREARYGPKRYLDEPVDVRAGNAARSRRREVMPRYRRSPSQPVILHKPEYDDYPREPLYLPVSTPRLQRRVAENGQGYYPEAIFNREQRRRSEGRRQGTVYEQRQRPERLFGDEWYT